MPGKNPRYSEVYKLAVLILVLKGEDPSCLAKSIQPTAATIRNWTSASSLTEENCADEELRRLKQERNSLAEALASVLGSRQPGSS